jgi:hypothetical protein
MRAARGLPAREEEEGAGFPHRSLGAGGTVTVATIIVSHSQASITALQSACTHNSHRCLQSFHRSPREVSLFPILWRRGRESEAQRR